MATKLGKRYRDKITGFEGAASSVTEFLYGCRRVCLTGLDANGKVIDFSFDEPGLEEIKAPPAVKPTKQERRTGGPHDRTMPTRTGH